MKFNGFSITDGGETKPGIYENFTLSVKITPYTYESCDSGILDCLREDTAEGIRITVGKGGHVKVWIGIHQDVVYLESLRAHLDYQKENLVTIGFWGEAGWVDLMINGCHSMRKQFARHGKCYLPEGRYSIGRMKEQGKDPRKGFFHGELEEWRFEEIYHSVDETLAEQQQMLRSSKETDLYEGIPVKQDRYHTVYHLCPPAKWMNEPHAAFYKDGYYHIFYQANPHGPIWDNICWGHLVSSDMVNWTYEGIALNPDSEPDNEIDPDGCWSGSTCINEEGVPVIFYTAGNNQYLPNQSVATAVPADPTDPKCRIWKKQGVLQRQPLDIGFTGEFRDPYVFRRGGKYYMLVGTGDRCNGGGNALVYKGDTIDTLALQGMLMDYQYELCPEAGHVWELPVLLPLYDQRGVHQADIFLLCSCQVENGRVETYYFLGHFNEETCKFQAQSATPGLIDLGRSIFTGPSGIVTKDKRSILFTIAQGGRNPVDEFQSGWAHNGGMPVELSMEEGALRVRPIREIESYFTETVYEGTDPEEAADILLLEHKAELTATGRGLTLELQAGNDSVILSYSKDSGIFRSFRKSDPGQCSIDRGAIDHVQIPEEESIQLEILVDHSLVEIYLNRRKSISLRNYEYEDGYRLKAGPEVSFKIRRYHGPQE
ncbi:MAG: glycoside hydrolase family 32 protein [Lachnospiraceae bacterium]|nr:glycoside hydrolase family 32 protein [Lachnospiraceae bacterium]